MNKTTITIFILIGLISSVNAAIHRLTLTDLTGDYGERIIIYQNDNVSTRYIAYANMSSTEPINVPAKHGVIIYVFPKPVGLMRDINGEGFINIIMHYVPLFVVLIVILSFIFYAYHSYKFKR